MFGIDNRIPGYLQRCFSFKVEKLAIWTGVQRHPLPPSTIRGRGRLVTPNCQFEKGPSGPGLIKEPRAVIVGKGHSGSNAVWWILGCANKTLEKITSGVSPDLVGIPGICYMCFCSGNSYITCGFSFEGREYL